MKNNAEPKEKPGPASRFQQVTIELPLRSVTGGRNNAEPKDKPGPASRWLGWLDLNQRVTESKSVALTAWLHPIIKM